MSKEKVAIYHRIMRRENFEVAAKDIIRLLRNTQESAPGKPRVLYVDINGHRNKDGEFDQDMLELQNEFGIGVLLQFFEEIHFPLIDVKNSKGQNNDVPDKLEIFKAKNKRDTSLDALYIENYSNTEFMSEPMVYNYLKHFADFLRYYKEWDSWKEENVFENTSETMLFTLWYRHLNEIINELFNNFIYGNLLSTAAMTRTLIECYVYISILIKEQNAKLIEEWFFCNLMTKMKKNDELKIEIVGAIKEYCNNQGIDFEVVYQKLLYKNENSWLSSVINKKRITFRDACEYLGEQEIYDDYQLLCSFVHGQDISSKMMPFVFYSSIYSKLFLMSHYIFKSIRMFKIDNVLEKKILKLEKELRKLGQEYCH